MSQHRFTGLLDWLNRWLSAGQGIDGRLVALGAVALYWAAVGLAAVGGVDLWRVLGVPSGPILFVDTHNLTAAAECAQHGVDPFLDNPCDVDDRVWNYSRLWLVVAWLGVDDSWRIPLGVGHVLAFLAMVWLLVGRLTLGQGIVLAVLLVSPAFMFAMEHGQADLLMFVVVAASAVLWRRPAWGWLAGPLLVALAGALKLFPIVALGAYGLARHGRALVVTLLAGLGFLAYTLATLEDTRLIAERAPQGQVHSYGARILVGRAVHLILGEGAGPGGVARQILAALTVVAVLGFVAWWASRVRQRRVSNGEQPVSWRLHAFHLGALVYVGSFLAANNWDYRLIFLALLLPQLFVWIGDRASPLRALAGLGLVAVVAQSYLGATLAYPTLHRDSVDWGNVPTWMLADEVVSWTLAGLLTALLVPSARSALAAASRRLASRHQQPG